MARSAALRGLIAKIMERHLSLDAKMVLFIFLNGRVPKCVVETWSILIKLTLIQGCYVYIMQETAEEDEDEVQNITYDLHHNHIASISRTSIQIWNIPDGSK